VDAECSVQRLALLCDLPAASVTAQIGAPAGEPAGIDDDVAVDQAEPVQG
jgi:hypothetical protein